MLLEMCHTSDVDKKTRGTQVSIDLGARTGFRWSLAQQKYRMAQIME